MTDDPRLPDDLPPGALEPCVDLLDEITEYLEDALPPARRQRIDEHLSVCDGCRTILDQWHAVVDLAGRVTTHDVDALDPSTRARLLASFRDRT